MAASEMSTAKTFAIIFGVLLIGPVMFLTSRYFSLQQRFDKVNVGDSVASVRGAMGPPAEEMRENLRLHGELEFHYSAWPVPDQWVIAFQGDKVVEKQVMAPP